MKGTKGKKKNRKSIYLDVKEIVGGVGVGEQWSALHLMPFFDRKYIIERMRGLVGIVLYKYIRGMYHRS